MNAPEVTTAPCLDTLKDGFWVDCQHMAGHSGPHFWQGTSDRGDDVIVTWFNREDPTRGLHQGT